MPPDPATQKILKATKFPPEFDKSVDKAKVNMDIIKTWIAGRIENLLPEDDIVPQMIFDLLDGDRMVSNPSAMTSFLLTSSTIA